jgi:Fe2+ transport system protein FeoA
MMSEVIKLNTGIKKYEIVNEENERVAELAIDTNDTHLMNRFIELYENGNKIKEACEKRLEDLGIDDGDRITLEDAKKILDVNEYAVKQMIEETEKLFGKGLFHEVFKENYELNPNFVPDVSLIQNFYEQIMPIVETIFKKQQKYSPAKKGNR